MFEQIAKEIYNTVNVKVNKATYDLSKCTDRDVNEKGSLVYIFKDSNNEVIYVGETGQAMRNRLYADGGGSHKRKIWYDEIQFIDVYKSDPKWDKHERKMIEEAFVFHLKPKYNK